MQNPLNWLKGAALVAVTVLCLSASYSLVTVGKHLSATLMATNDTIKKLDNEIDEMHRLTLEAGLTAMEARKASAKESAYLDTWNTQIAATMTDVQNVMIETQKTVASIQPVTEAATNTLQTTQQTVQALQVPISQATATLQALQPVIAHTDALVSDPAIAATLANVQGTTAHLDATAGDVQAEVYKYTHPGIWSKIKGVVLDIAHVFNPL